MVPSPQELGISEGTERDSPGMLLHSLFTAIRIIIHGAAYLVPQGSLYSIARTRVRTMDHGHGYGTIWILYGLWYMVVVMVKPWTMDHGTIATVVPISIIL